MLGAPSSLVSANVGCTQPLIVKLNPGTWFVADHQHGHLPSPPGSGMSGWDVAV
jgi:hypothetical protein